VQTTLDRFKNRSSVCLKQRWKLEQAKVKNGMQETLYQVISYTLHQRSGTACVNEESNRFTCHPTRLSTTEMSNPEFISQPQSITALWLVLIYWPMEGRRLSWPRNSLLSPVCGLLRWVTNNVVKVIMEILLHPLLQLLFLILQLICLQSTTITPTITMLLTNTVLNRRK